MNPSRLFPSLPIIAAATPSRPLRICIASPDFVGPIRNGGIGTAYTSMADALAAAGHDVTCLYGGGTLCASHDIDHWTRDYAARGVRLVPMPSFPGSLLTSDYAKRSYEAYHWLKRQPAFDYIHFPEWQGLGYYTTLAKKQGLAFAGATICVGIHSMTTWLKEGAKEHLNSLCELQTDFMERESVRLCDVAVSPSHYLLNWISDRGWQLPELACVQQYLMPRSARRTASPRPDVEQRIDELVFFGRLETRKGVHVFCDALDLLPADAKSRIRQITFLGKDSTVDGMPATAFIKNRIAGWGCPVQFLTDCNQPEAVAYLGGKGRLAVISSQLDNSPLTIYECLGAGIAFIATRIGGIPELIAPKDVDRVCFENRPQALADRFVHVLTHGYHFVRPSLSAEDNEKIWLAWHETHNASRSPAPATATVWPKVSVCISTFNRPKLLRQALDSVRALTYPNFEVIVVDDGGTQPEAVAYLDQLGPEFARRGWKIVRQPNRYLGAARNEAARHATGEYLLFMDDDNAAEPHELTTLVTAALHSGADILSCGMNQFTGADAPDRALAVEKRWLPLGPSVPVGVFCNCFGDANSLVRRSCFEQVGGYTEDYGVTHEDWEFLAKAVIKGFTLQVVPEFLFWYRVSPDSMYRTLHQYPNQMRHIRPYVNAVPPEFRTLVHFAQGLFLDAIDKHAMGIYNELTIKWRSKLEAGIALADLGQGTAAAKLMLAGITAVQSCNHPRVLLEALLGIGPQLARFDVGRARFLLNLAAETAEKIEAYPALERARQFVAALPAATLARPAVPPKIAPHRLTA